MQLGAKSARFVYTVYRVGQSIVDQNVFVTMYRPSWLIEGDDLKPAVWCVLGSWLKIYLTILLLNHFLQPMMLKIQGKVYYSKNQIPLFVLYLESKQMKIFVFKDFLVFFNSAYF
jgi:hypothetical protein